MVCACRPLPPPSHFNQNQNLTKYYLSREDISKMPIIKFVDFFGAGRQYKNQVFIFPNDN